MSMPARRVTIVAGIEQSGIPGDVNHVSVVEVAAPVAGDAGGPARR